MKVKIDYYVYCFDRYLTVEVNDTDKEQAEKIMDAAYDEWHQEDTCMCCEEYICSRLADNGIEYEWEA